MIRPDSTTMPPFRVSYGALQRFIMRSLIAPALVVVTSVIFSVPVATADTSSGLTYTVETCLLSPDCWVRYDFLHDDVYYPCYGERFVRYLDKYQMYVGVRVCREHRYHIFLSRDMLSIFFNVADRYGSGEDHCEFIGGNVSGVASTDSWYHELFEMKGFYRNFWGDSLSHGNIGNRRRERFVPWVECLYISMPPHSYVVQANGDTYPPAKRECYLTALSMREIVSWRHTTTLAESSSSYTLSCTTNLAVNGVEVHVVALEEATEQTSADVHVNIEHEPSLLQHPVILVLTSKRAIHWKVTVRDVQIARVTVMCQMNELHLTNLTITEAITGAPLSPPSLRDGRYLYHGDKFSLEFKEYIEENFGAITSFIGSQFQKGITLKTGTSATPNAGPPSTREPRPGISGVSTVTTRAVSHSTLQPSPRVSGGSVATTRAGSLATTKQKVPVGVSTTKRAVSLSTQKLNPGNSKGTTRAVSHDQPNPNPTNIGVTKSPASQPDTEDSGGLSQTVLIVLIVAAAVVLLGAVAVGGSIVALRMNKRAKKQKASDEGSSSHDNAAYDRPASVPREASQYVRTVAHGTSPMYEEVDP